MSIDWSNKKSKISKYFTVDEATFLPRIRNHCEPNSEEKENIIKTAEVMDKIRELLNAPITVSVWIRPLNHKYQGSKSITVKNSKNENVTYNPGDAVNYNSLIGGAVSSSHVSGLAVDFFCSKYSVDEVLNLIEPKCSEYGFALENNGSVSRIAKKGGTGGPRNWVHLQIRPLARDPKFRIFNP